MKKTSLILLALLTACAAPQQPQTPQGSLQIQSRAQSPSQTVIPVGKSPHGMAASLGYIYNANTGDNTVSVIDASSKTVVKTLSVDGGKPGYLKASHAGKHILMLDPGAGKLHIYAPDQDHALLQSLAVGSNPDKLLLSADDRKVWVSLSGEATLAEVDFSQGLDHAGRVKKIPTGKGMPDGKGHRSLAAGLAWLATPNPGDNDVSLIGPAGESLRVQTGNTPTVVGFGSWDGADRVLMIGNQASNTLSLVALDTQKTVTLAEVGQTPTDIAIVPGLNRAFVTMAGSNEVAVLDYRAQKLLARIPVGKRPVHIYSAPGNPAELWVGNDSGDSVSVIDPDTLSVKATHPVGKGHHKMAFWQNKAFISNISDGTIHVIARNPADKRSPQ